MKDAQVERQHRSHEDVEKNPEQYGIHERSYVQIELEMKIGERESQAVTLDNAFREMAGEAPPPPRSLPIE